MGGRGGVASYEDRCREICPLLQCASLKDAPRSCRDQF